MRFPEFTSEWKKYKADTLFDFFSTNSLSWSELTYVSGNTKNYHYGLIHRGLPILTDVNDDRIPFLINDEDRKNKELVRKGDLIFADASEDYSGIGQAIEIISDSIPAVAGLHTIHAREKKNLMELGFKGFLFNSTKIKDQLRRLAVGTKVYGISSKHFKDVNVSIPQDKNEQNKISLFLSVIDKKIETQRKLIDNYESLIKWIIDIEFNVTDNNTILIGDSIIEKSNRNENNIELDIFSINNKVGFVLQESQFQGRNIASEDISNYKIVNTNNFAFNPSRINVGSIARLKNYKKGIISPMYTCFDVVNEKIEPEYLEIFFLSEMFKKELSSKLEGSVRQSLSFDNLQKIKIRSKDAQHQKEFAENISKFQRVIKILKSKHSELLKLKDYFLSEMFI